jgi:acetyl-CoA acetyltransferase
MLALRGEHALACDAIMAAAKDAGIPTAEIDGFASFGSDSLSPAVLQNTLRMKRLRTAAMAWHPGGGGSCGALALASSAIETGQADTVAVVRSICQRDGERYGLSNGGYRALQDFNVPFGVFSPVTMMALVTQRYMHVNRASQEDLGCVAVSIRQHARRNPRAMMRDRAMTLEDYLNSRLIADPLRLLDCCLETDGACAVLVTTRERARDLARPPVTILAAAVGCDQSWGAGVLGGYNTADELYITGNARDVAATLYSRAGVAPADIDVAQIYDAFTIMVLLGLEDYGFCEQGAAATFVGAGEISWPDGSLPVNTAGGNLSEAYVQGLNHVVEGVRQLRGESSSQVEAARICLVTGGLSEGPTSGAILTV